MREVLLQVKQAAQQAQSEGFDLGKVPVVGWLWNLLVSFLQWIQPLLFGFFSTFALAIALFAAGYAIMSALLDADNDCMEERSILGGLLITMVLAAVKINEASFLALMGFVILLLALYQGKISNLEEYEKATKVVTTDKGEQKEVYATDKQGRQIWIAAPAVPRMFLRLVLGAECVGLVLATLINVLTFLNR